MIESSGLDTPTGYLDLYDYRQRVFALYRERNEALQRGEDPALVLERFRAGRDRLFATHPQSALDVEQRRWFQGLPYYPYNPMACVEATIDLAVGPARMSVETSGEEPMPMTHVATVRFRFGSREGALALYWIEVYGGGLFLPFRDSTAPRETYGGGRYLFDTVKGSDFILLPEHDGPRRMLLDFNYAYNPSCAYNYRWACPLAPQVNHLPFAVPAGEKKLT